MRGVKDFFIGFFGAVFLVGVCPMSGAVCALWLMGGL